MSGDPPEPPGQWPDGEDLDALREPRRAELRAEAEAYEQLAAKDLLRGRRLADVAVDLGHRGARVTVAFADRSFTGSVVGASEDLLSLLTSAGQVDVNLKSPLTLRAVEGVGAPVQPPVRGPTSFTARLAEYEAAACPVEVGLRNGADPMLGRIEAVAVDHVALVLDGEDWFVRREAIDYVLARSW